MDIKNRMDKIIPFSGKHNADIIIQGGTILSMVDGEGHLNNVSMLIRKNRIVDIQPPIRRPYPEGTEIIDASNCLIMPGLVNAHTHAAMTIFRGYADDLPLKKWLFEKIFPAEAKYLNSDSVYWGSLLACLEMIRTGTTSFVDGYFFQDGTIRAAHKAGLRALIAQGVIDFPAPGVPDPSENLNIARDFINKWSGFSPLITSAIFCHSPLTCSAKTLTKARQISNDFSLPLQIHLSETSEEVDEIVHKTGKRPVKYLDELGLMDGELIAAHAVHVDEREMELLVKGV